MGGAKTRVWNFSGVLPHLPAFGRSGLAALLAGLFAIILGTAVMFGWLTSNTALMQINPAFVPMQFNTALGFVLGGLGLVFLVFAKPAAAGVLGAGVAVLGLLTLAQYVWGADFGFDEFFMDAYVTTKTSHPGRMAPISALCFSLFGLGLISASLTKFRTWPRPAGEFLGVLVAVIGTTALLGYLLGREQFFTWADMTLMAVHTAAGFIVLALGLLTFTLGQRKEKIAAVPVLVPGLLVVGALAFDIGQPLEIAAGIAYLPLVFCGLWFRDEKAPLLFAATASVLTVLGFFYSVDLDHSLEEVITNRALAIMAFWVTAYVITRQRQTKVELAKSEQKLRERSEKLDKALKAHKKVALARETIQDKLNHQAKFQETVFNHMLDGLAVINEQGILLSVNAAMEQIFGYSKEEMLGNNIKMLMKGENRKNHDQYLKNYIETGEAKIIGIGREVVGCSKEGKPLNLDLSVTEFNHEGNRIFLGNLRDLTERTLEREKHLRELTEINKILERSNADLEQFAYIASHDLRAPLRAIDNLSQWIEEDLENQLEGETRENMDLLRGRVKRLEKLLDDILEYSRVGRIEGKTGPVDTHKLAREAIDLLDIPKGFKVGIDGRLPEIRAPEGVFEQIFSNLINNALKHHDRKKGSITLSAREGKKAWEFCVEDDGPGIPAEYRERVFLMFQKLKGRDKTEGSGMGLAIVRKLIRARGGEIRVRAARGGRGSAFVFTWPKKPPGKSVIPPFKGGKK